MLSAEVVEEEEEAEEEAEAEEAEDAEGAEDAMDGVEDGDGMEGVEGGVVHKQPRGRPKAGKVWNGATGRWDDAPLTAATAAAPAGASAEDSRGSAAVHRVAAVPPASAPLGRKRVRFGDAEAPATQESDAAAAAAAMAAEGSVERGPPVSAASTAAASRMRVAAIFHAVRPLLRTMVILTRGIACGAPPSPPYAMRCSLSGI